MAEPEKIPENASRLDLELHGTALAIQAIVQVLLANDANVEGQFQRGLKTVFANLAKKPEFITAAQLERVERATWTTLGIEAPPK